MKFLKIFGKLFKAGKKVVKGENKVGQVVHGLLDLSPVANNGKTIPNTEVRIYTSRVVFIIIVLGIIAEVAGIDLSPYFQFAESILDIVLQ